MMRSISAAIAVFATAATVQAEVIREVSVNSMADNNIFATSEASSDYLTEVSTYIANAFGGQGYDTRLFYQGTGYLFANATERSFTTQEVGIAHIRKLGKGRNALYAGASFLTRIDRTDYNVYDHAGMRAFLNAKVYVQSKTMLRVGYHLATRNYWNLDASSYADHYLFGQITHFLPSRTTLRGDLSYSYKTHFADEGQVVLGAQLAQSLTPSTGVSLRFQRRFNTLSPAQDVLFGGLRLDEDILVDRYDYSGSEYTVRLAQQLPRGASLVVHGGYETQTYDDQVALDGNGAPLSDLAIRLDRITYGQIGLELPLVDRLELGLDYRIDSSESTDAYYHYDGRRSLSLNLGLRF